MATNFIDKYESGSIFEIPLLDNYGYCYLKLHKFHTIENEFPVITPILRVIDYFSKSKLADIKVLENINYTFTPLILLGNPRVKGRLGWRYKGSLPIKSIDEIIPAFSFTMKYSALLGRNGLTINDVTWSKIRKLSMIKDSSIPATFDEIRGLGFWVHQNSIAICAKLTLLWAAKNNEPIEIEKMLIQEGIPNIIDIDLWEIMLSIENPNL